VIGFGIVAVCARHQLRGIEEGLACAGIGYGIVMPGIIKAVIGDIDERHAFSLGLPLVGQAARLMLPINGMSCS
jgi:hypothetical protein